MIILKIKGGLGNQLFQYSTGRALALHLNTELKLDLTFFNDPKFIKVYRLDQFNLNCNTASDSEIAKLKNKENPSFFFRMLNKFKIKISPFFKSSHILETEINKLLLKVNMTETNYYLEGWLGNESYFINSRAVLLKELNLDHLLKQDNLRIFKQIQDCESIAVHIRRGDYLKSNFFETLSVNYYLKAMDYISTKISNPVFYFFSDDVNWVKNEFSNIKNSIFVEGNSNKSTEWSTSGDLEDLMLLRRCKHQIIANSTYSWWGAWLNENPNKIIVAPEVWFKDTNAQNQYKNSGLIPSNWTKI